jgi:NAD(P)-dependent dehydrogenase (short-subunit alcohol dehydrogenase family)
MGAWDGRTAIVTGASRGIGRATALELAGQGCRLALLARDEEALEATAASCRERGAPEPLVVPVDVTDGRELEQAAGTALEYLGPELHLLANVAGSALKRAPLVEQSDADWQLSYDLHVMAPVRLQRSCFEALCEGRGAIVNVGSVAASQVTSHGGPYSAAKAALASLTRTTTVEWARFGIRVCTVEPGYVATPFNEETEEAGLGDLLLKKVPTRKRIDPEEVARLIVFLGAAENESINGAVVRIDGGMMAKL